MPLCFSLISYLSFVTEIGKCEWQSLQPCKFLTESKLRAGLSIKFVGCIVLARGGHQKIIAVIAVMMLIKITGVLVYSVELYKVNMSLHTWINRFTLHNNSDNISSCLLWSVNTLNSKLIFKTILINKLQLLLKALYLEVTLTFLCLQQYTTR